MARTKKTEVEDSLVESAVTEVENTEGTATEESVETTPVELTIVEEPVEAGVVETIALVVDEVPQLKQREHIVVGHHTIAF